MTLTALRQHLERIRDTMGGDPEIAHGEADRALVAFASSKGGDREGILVEKVWDEIPKWYA